MYENNKAPWFKLSILAGDETGDADFILFGRHAQRLTKKTADTLIADNPVGFIPDEITSLLEKTFIWSVTFTESTIDSGNVTFQVNAVVAKINDGSAVIPATPEASQASSFMLSGCAGASELGSPQKSHAFPVSSQPAASETSLASATTPTKDYLCPFEPPETPQSVKNAAPAKDVPSVADVFVASSTKAQKGSAKKRSRPSPENKISKKLFAGDEVDNDNDASDGGEGAADHISPSKGA